MNSANAKIRIPPKILVIDDDRTLTTLLDSTLAAAGFQVTAASNGIKGLSAYHANTPDVIILDIMMPEMDGFTFVQEFKRLGGDVSATPIIVLSSRDKMQDIFAIEGINDYIVKPFQMEDLLRKIERHLESPQRKILVVDDAPETVAVMESGLANRGYDVLTAIDGMEALETAKREVPDLMVLDVMMPKLGGFNICRMLKYDDKYKNIPIILLSALGEDKDRLTGQEVGADAYLTKPFTGNELLSTMKELLWD